MEHWRSIRQHPTGLSTNREEKYAYMAANGGMCKWFFLPYISCGRQIELNRLQHLEQSVIQRFPNALNRCRHPACTQRVVRSSADMDTHAQDVARKAACQGYDDSRVDTAVSYVNSADDTGPEVTHLINNAMNTMVMHHDCMAFILSMEHYTVCKDGVTRWCQWYCWTEL